MRQRVLRLTVVVVVSFVSTISWDDYSLEKTITFARVMTIGTSIAQTLSTQHDGDEFIVKSGRYRRHIATVSTDSWPKLLAV